MSATTSPARVPGRLVRGALHTVIAAIGIVALCILGGAPGGGTSTGGRPGMRDWMARLRVGVIAVIGLLLLGAPLGRSLIAGGAFVLFAALGVNWSVVSGAAGVLLTGAVISWAMGIPLL